MSSKREEEIRAKLGRSIKKKTTNKPPPEPPSKPLPPVLASKLSISLTSTDLEKLHSMQSFLMQQGVSINVSAAIKLAIRECSIGKGLLSRLDEVRAEDGRRKRAKPVLRDSLKMKRPHNTIQDSL